MEIQRDIKPRHRLNALNGAGLLLGVRCGYGILMERMPDHAGYMDKDGLLKDTKEMSYLEDVLEVKCSKMVYFVRESQIIG